MATAIYRNMPDELQLTASATLAVGQVLQHGSGLAGVNKTANVVSGDPYALAIAGEYEVAKTTGGAWTEGEEIFWDASANEAVPFNYGLDGSEDFYLGVASRAAGSTATTGFVLLNAGWQQVRPFVVSMDWEDTAEKVIIPASMNENGLIIEAAYAEVLEQPAGASEDQLIVTLEDEDDNAKVTLTTSATPDAVGDIIQGVTPAEQAATGAVLAKVAAGKALQAQVTQATAGAGAAGTVAVYVRVRRLAAAA